MMSNSPPSAASARFPGTWQRGRAATVRFPVVAARTEPEWIRKNQRSTRRSQEGLTHMTRQPTLRPTTQGRTITVVGDIYRFLATGAETDGKFATWEAIVPPGGGPPPHVHRREEESFYVLEG